MACSERGFPRDKRHPGEPSCPLETTSLPGVVTIVFDLRTVSIFEKLVGSPAAVFLPSMHSPDSDFYFFLVPLARPLTYAIPGVVFPVHSCVARHR